METEQIDWSKLPALADTYNKLGLWRFADAVIKLTNLGDRINELPAYARQVEAEQARQRQLAASLPAFAEAYNRFLAQQNPAPRFSWDLAAIKQMIDQRQNPSLSDLLRG